MSARAGWTTDATLLLAGPLSGEVVVLDEPLSMWGGLDPATGRVIDVHHAQRGLSLADRIVAMPSGRGSSSSSSVLAEAIRAGVGPRALILSAPDGILLIGALVAEELAGRRCPIIVLPPAEHRRLRSGDHVELAASGRLTVRPAPR